MHLTIPEIYLPANQITTVTINTQTLSRQGYSARDYDHFYITNDQLNTGWSTLVADPLGYDWSSYTATKWAKHHRRIIKMSGPFAGGELILTVNLTKGNTLTPPSFISTTSQTGKDCWLFLLWGWSGGKDPNFLFSLCEIKCTKNSTSPTEPLVSPAGVKLGIIASPPPETADDWFRVSTGVSGQSNNWLLVAEQAANVTNQNCIVCMGPRPILRMIPSTMPAACVVNVMSQMNPSVNCRVWDEVHPLVKETLKKSIFLKQVAAGNFTCINMTGIGTPITNVLIRCQTVLGVDKTFKPLSRSDIWWWCGDDRLFDRLPRNVTGLCALVTLLFPVSVFPDPEVQSTILIQRESFLSRSKRSTMLWQDQGDPTYIDAIGVPRGVPDEYKLVDQVVAGFESSICWWCTINKNVDRINYIHYNVQKL